MARRRSTARAEYDFDPRLGSTGRYVDRNTGRIVATDRVAAALETQISQSRDNMQTVSTQLAEGNINIAQWQDGMMREMQLIHTHSAALAKGGWDQMTPSDWGAVGQLTKEQYAFLREFSRDIKNGDQRLRNLAGEINGQFLRRADLYAQAGAGTYSQMERRQARQNAEITHERRVLDPRAQHCACCPEQAAKGWQPIGNNDILPIGACDCSTNCRCKFVFGRLGDDGRVVGIIGDEPVEEGPPGVLDLSQFKGVAPDDNSITISDGARLWLLENVPDEEAKSLSAVELVGVPGGIQARYKMQIARHLSRATGIDKELTSEFVRLWADTSNDHSYPSLLAQKEVADKFGLELSDWQQERWDTVKAAHDRRVEAIESGSRIEKQLASEDFTDTRARSPYEDRGEILASGFGMPEKYETPEEATRATLDAMYERTQAELKEAGIETVTLYRGLGDANIFEPKLEPGDIVSLDGNALESWSINPRTAMAFSGSGGALLKMEVPVERIFCTSKTGYGSLLETEFVIIGGEDMGEAINMDIHEVVATLPTL